MAFRAPVFNLSANVWHTPNAPPAAPDLTVNCQLRTPGKQTAAMTGPGVPYPTYYPSWELLVPAGTDLRDSSQVATEIVDVVEVPAGSGRYYDVMVVDDVAKGFTNEYRLAYLLKETAYGLWPIPMP